MRLGKIRLDSDFNKNVAILFAGTTIAQAVPVAISPILTRLYSPEEFGLFALFFSICNVLGVVATARYELAMVLPKEEHSAGVLETLCYSIALGLAMFLLIVVILFHDPIVDWLGNPDLGPWLYLVPICVFFTGVIQTYSYKLNRNKNFRHLSRLKISQTTGASIVSLFLGFVKWLKNGLIVGHLIGQLTTIAIHARRFNVKGVSIQDLKETAISYRNFALYNAPAALLNTTAAGLPVFYLSKILKKEDVGFYGLVERSIGAPISLISYSISQVLLEDIASRHRQELPIRGNLIKLVATLSLIGIVPFATLFFFSEEIFSFIFGAAWAEAGKYASILAVAFFMRFVVSPLSMVLVSTNNLKVLVAWQTMYFVTTLGVVLFSMHAQEATQFLVALAVNDVIMYGLYLYLILRVVRA